MAPSFTSRLITFYQHEPVFNSVVTTIFVGVVALFITGVTEKVNGIDNTVDFIKVFIVGLNSVLLGLLLFQKSILTKGNMTHRLAFGAGLFILAFLIILNLTIVGILRESAHEVGESGEEAGAEEDERTPVSFVPYNYDYLTLAATIVTDLLYLLLYCMFKVRTASIVSACLLVVNIIILGVAIHLDTDIALDISNFVLALITCFLAFFTWTAKVTLSERGEQVELTEYGLLLPQQESAV
jgi:hypothetical protein